jgi:uncharacterized membrane protein YdjX (TVP38/TMEM64 family)
VEANPAKNHKNIFGAARLAIGILLAYVLYQAALNFATTDCREIQTSFQLAGPTMALRLVFAATLAAAAGVPAAIIAVIGGVLTGPFMGVAISSFGLTAASTLFWVAGRYFYKGPVITQTIDRKISASGSYQAMMADKSISGFHWTAINSFCSVFPFPLFALIAGQKIPHLSFQSLITGLFAGSIALVAGYTLAGASIGCSLINFAQGVEFSGYRTLMIISCLILALTSRIQSQLDLKGGG